VTSQHPFDELGLDDGATADDVRAARRALAKDHHPDQGGDAETMQRINQAAAAALRLIEQAAEPQPDSDGPTTSTTSTASPPGPGSTSGSAAGRVARDRVVSDVPSFTVEALPVETFEALVVVASWLGDILDDDPPYRLDTYLGDPFDCWCGLEVVPDAGGSTVSLAIAGIDGTPTPDLIAVRDAWISNLNAVDWP
jgi:hypothetical protein